jgi:hypothetical protein
MEFADLIAPVGVDTFLDDIYDRKPLHIPAEGAAGERRRALFPWSRLNDILGIAGHWGEENVKVILNGNAVPNDYYLTDVATRLGLQRRADPAKVETLLSMGASLVTDAVEDASAELKQLVAMLSMQFMGTSGANAYCSFRGVQAFRSHVDLHDVFAVHCEGEKTWLIYQNRAPDPVDQHRGPAAQAEIDRLKGPVMMEVRMRPGDLLYIPRGYYHDALASSEASLHLSLSVARHHGRSLFRILETLAMGDPAFRAYLPDGRVDGGRQLRERIEALSGRVAEMMRTPAFEQAVVNAQLELAKPFRTLNLPERPRPEFLHVPARGWRIDVTAAGAELVWERGRAPLGLLEAPARWLLAQNQVSVQQFVAHFPHYGEPALRDLIALLERAGLVERPRAGGVVTTRVGG